MKRAVNSFDKGSKMVRKEKSDKRRKQILRSAESIMSIKGVDATISEIASNAGVPSSNIYHYFKNKEDLLFSVVGDNIGNSLNELEADLKGIREPLSQLGRFIWSLLNRADNETDVTEISLFQCRSKFSFWKHEAFEVHIRRYFEIIHRILEKGVSRGEFDEGLHIRVIRSMIGGSWGMGNLRLNIGESATPLVDDFDDLMDLIEALISPTPALPHKKQDKEKRILEAAEKVFGLKGYDDSTIQDVVKEAKVADSSAYWYFKNKEELLNSCFIKGFQRMDDSFDLSGPGGGEQSGQDNPLLIKLEKVLTNFYTIAVKQPDFSKILVLNGVYSRDFYKSKAYNLLRKLFDRMAGSLEEGKSNGSIRKEVNSRLFQNMVLGTFSQSVIRWHIVENASWHQVQYDVKKIVSYLLKMVRSPGDKKES
ncbi:MAG: TetR/AcrR family transcriptional regulator [Deltaproteobacteria bacterium]|nr:TetR/AcrR family transcriptional regulator [Deltaproteobacteria bacterium]